MTRRVRKSAGPAPHWQPDQAGLVATAATRRAQAGRLTAAVLDGNPAGAGAALAARAEARVAASVAGYTPPCLDPSGPLPFAPGRGGLDHATIPGFAFDATADALVVADRPVRKRRGPSALSRLPPALRAAGERYAALVEAVSSPGCPDPGAPKGGLSDGGATTRCGLAEQLQRRALPAIGHGVVLRPRGLAEHTGRPRHILTVRDLVDRVCLRGWPIDRVLSSRGWSRRHAHGNACHEALAAALTRLARVI